MSSNDVDADLLRSRYRLTKQRAAILHALEDGAHLTAESLLERVRIELPVVSLGTIYRTVDILREIGLVQVFAHRGLAARYEASLNKHHHLVCEICHDITNIHVPALEPVVSAIAGQYRYEAVDAALTLSGRCSSCSSTLPASNGRAALTEPSSFDPAGCEQRPAGFEQRPARYEGRRTPFEQPPAAIEQRLPALGQTGRNKATPDRVRPALDCHGMELRVDSGDDRVSTRIRFDHVLQDSDDARTTLIATARHADGT